MIEVFRKLSKSGKDINLSLCFIHVLLLSRRNISGTYKV